MKNFYFLLLLFVVYQSQGQLKSKVLSDQDVELTSDNYGRNLTSYKIINKKYDSYRKYQFGNQMIELQPGESLISTRSSDYYTESYFDGITLSKKSGTTILSKIEKPIGYFGEIGTSFFHIDVGDGAVSSVVSIYDEDLNFIKTYRPLPNLFSPVTATDTSRKLLFLAGENDDKQDEFVLAKISEDGHKIDKITFEHENFDLVGLEYTNGYIIVNLRNSWKGLCKIYNSKLKLIDSSVINHHVRMNWVKYDNERNELAFIHQGKIKLINLSTKSSEELDGNMIMSELEDTRTQSFVYTAQGEIAVLTKSKSTGEMKFLVIDRDQETLIYKELLKDKSQDGRIIRIGDQTILETNHQLTTYTY